MAELMFSGFEGVWENNDSLCFYINEEDLNMPALKVILERYGLIESYTFKAIENINWNESWEQGIQPIRIGDSCIVRTLFHDSPGLPYEIIITPKMSFGTGHHETTYMMAESMLSMNLKNKTVLDMGCGTSVLSILAEKLGAIDIAAIDNDDWAIENSKENILNNNCKFIRVVQSNAEFEGKFDLILSNINRNINLGMLSKYAESINPSSQILLSGFYMHDVPDFEITAQQVGLKIVNVNERNSWACLTLETC